MIVRPEGVFTVFADRVIAKRANVGLGVVNPLEELLFVEIFNRFAVVVEAVGDIFFT